MEETLVKSSGIVDKKMKFFLFRSLTYFPFLLVPVYRDFVYNLSLFGQFFLLTTYICFMASQWYQLGKEIDHRFKIFYRTNSSIDRIIYRFFIGSMAMFILFNFIHLFNIEIQKFFFWAFFIVMGLFYSWPTRGKIIEESIYQQFKEFRFLDSFEKNILTLVVLFFLVSIPELPIFENIEALKLYLDPIERIHPSLWTYYSVLFLPFYKYPSLLSLSLCLIIYIKGLFLSLVCLYAFCRYFFSRRLAVLSTLVYVSSWAFFINVEQEYMLVLTSSLPIFLIWSLFWVYVSQTYRSGLFLGLVCFWGTLLDVSNVLLVLPLFTLVLLYLSDKTFWYRKQVMKYSISGLVLITLALITSNERVFQFDNYDFKIFLSQISFIFSKKAFLSLSGLGVIIIVLNTFNIRLRFNKEIFLNSKLVTHLWIFVAVMTSYGFFINRNLINNISSFWIFIFLSLLPIEYIFQNLFKDRSKRNAIFIFYILVVLLDSHIEGRVRNVTKIFVNDLILKDYSDT